MKPRPPKPARAAPGSARAARPAPKIRRAARGLSLTAQVYWALGAQGLALIWITYGRDDEYPSWQKLAAAIFVLTTLLSYLLRMLVQDWHSTARPAEKLFVPLLVLGAFQAPFWFQNHYVFPEGFVFALIPLMFFSFNHAGLLWVWGCACAGGWFALGSWPDAPLWAPLGLGGLAVWSLGAIHFASVGEPFGLRGWWPFRRVATAAVLFSLPGAISAWVFNDLSPVSSPRARPMGESDLGPGEMDPMRVVERIHALSRAEVMDLLLRVGLSILTLFIALVALWMLRRWMGKRAKPQRAPILFGGEISEAEIREVVRPEARPTLGGARGEALSMWRRWEGALRATGRARAPDETAAAFAARIAGEAGSPPAVERITRLMESAHYSSEEPSDEDLEVMRGLVRAEIADSVRRKNEAATQ